MPFPLPAFNLTMNVWDNGRRPVDGAADRGPLPCQKYIESHGKFGQQVGPTTDGIPPIIFRFQVGDILGNETVVECPAASGKYYMVYFRENMHEGFANEYGALYTEQCTSAGRRKITGLPDDPHGTFDGSFPSTIHIWRFTSDPTVDPPDVITTGFVTWTGKFSLANGTAGQWQEVYMPMGVDVRWAPTDIASAVGNDFDWMTFTGAGDFLWRVFLVVDLGKATTGECRLALIYPDDGTFPIP